MRLCQGTCLAGLVLLIGAGCGNDEDSSSADVKCKAKSEEKTSFAAGAKNFTMPKRVTFRGAGSPRNADTPSAGVAFTTVDSQFTSSALHFRDRKTGSTRTILDGESGDPWLTWARGELFLFNRKAPSINYRSLDPRKDNPAPSTQRSTPCAGTGDPHAVLNLADDRLLLGNYVKGELPVINPDTGELVERVDAEWDVGDDGILRPEDFWYHETRDGIGLVYVLHQGVGKTYKLNGTQQIFILRDQGSRLDPMDLNADKAGVQGVKLKVSKPLAFYPSANGDSELLIPGLCTLFDPPECRSGFERLDLETNETSFAFDMKDSKHLSNAGFSPAQSKDPSVFYTLMTRTTAGGQNKKYAASINVNAGTVTPFHEFPPEHSGCCALYLDPTAKRIFVGDRRKQDPDNGRLILYDSSQTPPQKVKVEKLDGVPYSGAVVPAKTQ